MRESLPEAVKDFDVHRTEGGQSLWTSRHVKFLEVCTKEALICKSSRAIPPCRAILTSSFPLRCPKLVFSHAVPGRSRRVSCQPAMRSTKAESFRTSSTTSRTSDKAHTTIQQSSSTAVSMFSCSVSTFFSNLFLVILQPCSYLPSLCSYENFLFIHVENDKEEHTKDVPIDSEFLDSVRCLANVERTQILNKKRSSWPTSNNFKRKSLRTSFIPSEVWFFCLQKLEKHFEEICHNLDFRYSLFCIAFD